MVSEMSAPNFACDLVIGRGSTPFSFRVVTHYDAEIVSTIKGIDGRWWDETEAAWRIPASSAPRLAELLPIIEALAMSTNIVDLARSILPEDNGFMEVVLIDSYTLGVLDWKSATSKRLKTGRRSWYVSPRLRTPDDVKALNDVFYKFRRPSAAEYNVTSRSKKLADWARKHLNPREYIKTNSSIHFRDENGAVLYKMMDVLA